VFGEARGVRTRGAHDVGGRDDFGEIPRVEEVHEAWHESVMRLLFSTGRFGLSRISGEPRYLIETLDPDEYRRLGYYERWAVAIAGLYSRLGPDAPAPNASAAIYPGAHASSVDAIDAPLDVGTAVAVVQEPPPGHHRLPGYTWGRRGVIDAVYPPQEVPGCDLESRRYEHAYVVAFTSDELWGDGGHDELRIDVWAGNLSPIDGRD
jgi:nitrile hydratase